MPSKDLRGFASKPIYQSDTSPPAILSGSASLAQRQSRVASSPTLILLFMPAAEFLIDFLLSRAPKRKDVIVHVDV